MKNEKMTKEEFDTVIVDLGNKKIDKLEFQELFKNIPTEFLIEYVHSFKDISTNAKETQVEALKNIDIADFNKYIEPLNIMLEKENISDEMQLKIIELIEKLASKEAEMQNKANESSERMNDGNNGLWQKALFGIGGLAIGAISIFLTNKNDKA